MNTSYFWMDKLGLLLIPFSIFLFFSYLALALILLYHVYWIIKEKLRNRRRNIIVVVMGITLGLVFLFQDGLIPFERFESKDLLIAEREGAANCNTILKLKANNEFIEQSICFAATKISGDYWIKGDSIFFSNIRFGRGENEYYQFAVITKIESQNKKILGLLKRFKNYNDTLPHDLFITKNEFKN